MIKIWWPDLYLESHRRPEQGARLAAWFEAERIQMTPGWHPDCEAIFCGSIEKMEAIEDRLGLYPAVPTIHYNWDLYDFNLAGTGPQGGLWAKYLQVLQAATEIWVPSRCTVEATLAATGRDDAVVMPAAVRPFPTSRPGPRAGQYILDPMRHYPDEGRADLDRAIERLGIPLVRTENRLHWDHFVGLVNDARFLVSTYRQASTGSLTLLEAHQLGKPVLLTNAPHNGGKDYFGLRARYYQWDAPEDLEEQLVSLWHSTPPLEASECRNWVLDHYGDEQFARRAAARFHALLGSIA